MSLVASQLPGQHPSLTWEQVVTGEPPPQTPLVQISPVVQALTSSQSMPSPAAMVVQLPVTVSQTPTLQPLVRPEQFLGIPPWQRPPEQVLATVQRSFGSVQASPSLPGTGSHIPLLGLQTAMWQSSGTGAKKQSICSPMQTPFWHAPLTRQRSSGSLQAPPFAIGIVPQLSLFSSQVISSQAGGVIPQSFCGPPTQTPFWQLSAVVQNIPSSHPTPSSSATTTHAPTVPG